MNGNFERAASAYPIGYLRDNATGDYRVTDMRTLDALHENPVALDEAVRVADGTNRLIRAGRVTDLAAQVQELLERV